MRAGLDDSRQQNHPDAWLEICKVTPGFTVCVPGLGFHVGGFRNQTSTRRIEPMWVSNDAVYHTEKKGRPQLCFPQTTYGGRPYRIINLHAPFYYFSFSHVLRRRHRGPAEVNRESIEFVPMNAAAPRDASRYALAGVGAHVTTQTRDDYSSRCQQLTPAA
jgi:hypothetical protein